MPSRKKAKGKARKAAKEAKAKQEESQAVGEEAATHRQEGSLEAQLHQLVISDVAPQKCEHGLVQLSVGEEKICLEFINAYLTAFSSQDKVASQEDMAVGLMKACCGTNSEHNDVYYSKLNKVVSMLLAGGAQSILDERNDIAQRYAMLACYFEEFMKVRFRKTRDCIKPAKIIELENADDHTLVSFYRKRISCSCLDKKYKEVKSVKKMGFCYNSNCSQGRKVERSKMFCCTQCGVANYCSVECQKADWRRHEQFCGMAEEAKEIATKFK